MKASKKTDAAQAPPLEEVLARYLERQASAHASGFGFENKTSEVLPHEAVPVQPVDPRLAWEEALAALASFQLSGESLPAPPPDWPALVNSQEPVYALPFCIGNYPQQVRNLLPLIRSTDLSSLLHSASRSAGASTLAGWAAERSLKRAAPQMLLTLGILRFGQLYDQAEEFVRQYENQVPHEWQAAWANERAALLWHRGRADAALASWQAQALSSPVLFNRGVATLFLGKPADARSPLKQAVAQLPEDKAWHHLGCLYLALAEMRS